MDANYLEVNKALWNARVPHHVASGFYDNDSFLQGRNSLTDIELKLLGDVEGKSILHLQCHFGQDTMSLSRMGAKVTGIDFSTDAIAKAKELALQLKLDTRFIESDVYKLDEVLDDQFDIVFTSYGVLGWLPDMKRWAEVVAHFLKPGGKLILVEFHPVVWMLDSKLKDITYSYFNRETIIENEEGTYTDKNAAIKLESISWNHDLSEVLQSIIDAGMNIEVFAEYDYSPYNCFSGMVEVEKGKYQVQHAMSKLPMVYAIRAVKK